MSYLFSIKHDITSKEFKSPDNLEANQYKNLIINWLCRRYNIEEFKYTFKVSFLSFSIWCNTLTISLDVRDEEQQRLFDKLPHIIKGTKQKGTGKLVNKNTLYFKLTDIIPITYPEIVKSVIFHTDKEKDDDGDDFIVYNWKIYLNDNTILLSSSQDKNEPMSIKYVYPTYIETRAFLKYLKGI